MKWIGVIVLFFIATFALYYVMFSIPPAVKKTKEAAKKNPQGTFAIIFLLVGALIGVILYFANA